MPAEPQRRLSGLRETGRLARKTSPRSAHGDYIASSRDPVTIIEQQHATRLERLIPWRMARMAHSAFTFFRGTAAIMAFDLRRQPVTGELVVASGDAYIANVGLFATPERHLTFELNDLERFSKRLNLRILEAEPSREDVAFVDRTLDRARRRTSTDLLPQVTTQEESGRLQIRNDLPILTYAGRDYHVRQCRDMKASIVLDDLSERAFNLYARYCGMLLGRSHAQSPAAPFTDGFLGTCGRFPGAIARWALAYVSQVEQDFAACQEATSSGRLPTTALV